MTLENPAKRKMSEMIAEMAGNFIDVGKTHGEKENRLNAACSAWNMACGSPEARKAQLDQYMDGYQNACPGTPPADLANIRTDMERLIERKLQMFPDDLRQIVSARIVMVGEKYRIEVASATVE